MISVILPSIHPDKIYGLIESFENSYSDDWEFIIITPDMEVPAEVMRKWGPNIKVITDWGSPVRCQQRALLACEGKYVTRAVDDSLYLPGKFDEAMERATRKDVIDIKFTESNDQIDFNHPDCQFLTMAKDEFYYLEYHKQTLLPYVPADFKIINFGIYPRKLLIEAGGWDCQFETIAIAELDLSIRLQLRGVPVILTDGIVLACGWTPGEEGDHAPLHHGFYADMEIYKRIYSNVSCHDRIKIDAENWVNAPSKWERRFGK